MTSDGIVERLQRMRIRFDKSLSEEFNELHPAGDPKDELFWARLKSAKAAKSRFDEVFPKASAIRRNLPQFSIADELDAAQAAYDTNQAEIAINQDLVKLVFEPFTLTRARETLAHSLMSDLIADKVLYFSESQLVKPPRDDKEKWEADWRTMANSAQVFIVEHNWRAAFQNAGLADEELKCPALWSLFEFRINNIPLCFMAMDGDPLSRGILYARAASNWIGMALKAVPALAPIIEENVRAILVALDAKVADTEIVRAPYKINRVREAKGRLPIYDYHRVKLANRTRPAPRLEAVEPHEYTRRRLHFRRGHWRHFDNHKTWINWMLVGDPDLGFVDKEYRL